MFFFQSLVFSADVLCISVLAWLTLCAAGVGRRGLTERSVGWLLMVLVIVVASGVLLGLSGGLGRTGFLLSHVAGLILLLSVRRKWREDWHEGKAWVSDWFQFFRSGGPEGLAVAGIMLLFAFLAVLSACAEPVVFDALTYRLSRVGQWLQDSSISHYRTDDPRINYMPVAPDLVISWLLGATEEGYKGAALSQMMGGVLVIGAMFGLAGLAGLGRRVALGAIVIVLGMANVAAQFTAIQSDLFTAGICAASYMLWHRALLRGESSIIAGVGFGLAWGSKGTMFYLAPGAALWAGWLLWRYRFQWRIFLPTTIVALLALLFFAGPSYLRNIGSYRSLFGPPEAVLLHHGESLTVPEHFEKLRQNLQTSAVQLFDPTAQPFWLADKSREMGQRLLKFQPIEDDRYLFLHTTPRQLLMEGIMQQVAPDGDIVSCGVLTVLLFGVGLTIAAWRCSRDQTAAQILVWGIGVVIYVLVQHALVQWHQWAYRFMVLAAPFMGIVAAWGISQFSRMLQVALWSVVVLSQFQVFVFVQWRASQAAWQAFTQPDHALSYFIYQHWREWASKLDRSDEPLRLALPINHALAAFYRQSPPRSVQLEKFSELRAESAETAVASTDGWLVVPVNRFKGHEGQVEGRTWLFNGEGDSLHSLAAYRRLQPGKTPVNMLYQRRLSTNERGMEARLWVKTWTSTVVVRVKNPAAFPWKVWIETSSGRQQESIPPGGEVMLKLPAKAEALTELVLNFEGSPANSEEMVYPVAAVIRQ